MVVERDIVKADIAHALVWPICLLLFGSLIILGSSPTAQKCCEDISAALCCPLKYAANCITRAKESSFCSGAERTHAANNRGGDNRRGMRDRDGNVVEDQPRRSRFRMLFFGGGTNTRDRVQDGDDSDDDDDDERQRAEESRRRAAAAADAAGEVAPMYDEGDRYVKALISVNSRSAIQAAQAAQAAQ